MTNTITFNYASGESRNSNDACDYILATVETTEEDYELYAETSDYSEEERENNEPTEEGEARRLNQLIEAIKEQIDNIPVSGFTFKFPDGSEYTK